MKAVVVGAGVLGSATAWELARRGASVTLIDASGPGSGTSSRGAGLVGEGLWHPTGIRLVSRSLEILRAFADAGREGTHPFRFFESSSTTLVPPEQVASARALAAMQRELGVDVREVAPEAVAALPRHGGIDASGAALALHYPRDGWGTPRLYCELLAFALGSQGGRVLSAAASLARDGRRVTLRANGERIDADAVVVACGIHTRALLQEAGLDAPLQAYRTQAARIEHPRAHELPNLHDAVLGWYMRPGPNGHLVAGNGTTTVPEAPQRWNSEADGAFVVRTLERLRARWPALEPLRVDAAWAGLDTATPDRLLLAGAHAGADGLWLCAGGNGHGFMRAPATGESLAALVLGEKPRVALDAYDPRRFGDASAPFAIQEGYSLEPPAFK